MEGRSVFELIFGGRVVSRTRKVERTAGLTETHSV